MTIVIFILVLGLLVLVHELGHFLAAKKAGCYVEEFGIGFPPRLFSVKKGETRYAINLLPLGGYVKIRGENGGESDDPRNFVNRPFGWKVLIISAGVIMNVLLGYVLISAGLMAGTPAIVDENADFGRFARVSDVNLQVLEVLEHSPASQAGITVNEQIAAVNGQDIDSAKDLTAALTQAEGPVTVTIRSGGQVRDIEVTPNYIEEIQQPGIGVALAEVGLVSYPWYAAPFVGAQRTAEILWLIVVAFANMIQQLVTGGGVQADIAGPVGIAVMTGEVARQGILYLMQFTALLSLNLAIINILPIPALDGGRLAMILYEKVRGKRLNGLLENWIHTLGFVALILLIIVVTAKDISTYGGGIWASVQSLFS